MFSFSDAASVEVEGENGVEEREKEGEEEPPEKQGKKKKRIGFHDKRVCRL